MYLYNKQGIEVQINEGEPFIPDKIIKVGVEEKERDLPDLESPIAYAYLNFLYKGVEYEGYYVSGYWMNGTNDLPRFCVSEKLPLVTAEKSAS